MSQSLASGTRIGHYSILAPIGAGAMGDVYRARDTKLGRDVALKILPEIFVDHPDRLTRFQREAEVLASLNHPNIAAIYGLEESEGVRALVLELAEGLTLEDRISLGPIPMDEALPIARQIAEAVESAHDQGVMHRDLKPANIKVTPDGVVKVLDFGLAKALEAEPTEADAANAATMTVATTQAGLILGTVAYMSPEQARGRPVDRRTDIWAFGAVCYEMLTGSRAFEDASVSDAIASILRTDPDWSALPADTPRSIEKLLRRCLEKDAKERLQHLGDARIEIRDALTAPLDAAAGAAPSTPLRAWQRPGLATLAAALLILLGGLGSWAMLGRAPEVPRPMALFGVTLPPSDQLGVGGLEFSPDGEQLLYVATRHGVRQLFRRSRSQLDPVVIQGTENAEHPFVSPDGEWLGFFADNALKKVPMAGGAAITVCEAGASYGGTWGPDGEIVFAHGGVPGLMRVSESGAMPTVLTTPAAGEGRHSSPTILPGGDAVIFTVAGSDPQLAVLSLETQEWRPLLPGSHARYAPTGHLVYWRDESLWAVGFDPDRLEATSEPIRIVEEVWSSSRGLAMFAFAGDGSLAYAPLAQSRRYSLVWVDREGRSSLVTDTYDAYKRPRVSPDGRRIAVDTGGTSDSDIWVIDIESGTRVRVTHDGISSNPTWGPQGDAITFFRGRGAGIFSVRVDGTDEPHQLLGNALEYPFAWSLDGRTLIYDRRTPEGLMDIWYATRDERDDLVTTSFVATSADEFGPTLSPDGRWLAYVSDESRRAEVYVERFPDGGTKRAVSVNGGGEPRWSGDGRELFYRQGNAVMMVPVRYEPEFAVGEPRTLFEGAYLTDRAPDYDVAPDGEQFLMIREVGDDTSASAQLVVIQSWFDELKAQVPTGLP